MTICILGAGAFGTALGVAFSEVQDVKIWSRDDAKARAIQANRINPRLPDITLPDNISVTSDLKNAVVGTDFVLSAVPLQSTRTTMQKVVPLMAGQPLIGCSKGMDVTKGTGGFSTLKAAYANGPCGVLTGPSFAIDIARGLPTALTLATDADGVEDWQDQLSTSALRLYASDDPVGAELGGALKNVIAIACGATMGAGFGESARAALMTRGNAEVLRFALSRGAKAETLTGLSGFGDLCLTCTSDKSRNYRYGYALGAGDDFDGETTVEGKATAQAMMSIMKAENLDMPITKAVALGASGEITAEQALDHLMSRPLKKEI